MSNSDMDYRDAGVGAAQTMTVEQIKERLVNLLMEVQRLDANALRTMPGQKDARRPDYWHRHQKLKGLADALSSALEDFS
jgi:hypothetical protein